MRTNAWLKRAFASIDMVYFHDQLKERSINIKWFRPPASNKSFLYGLCHLDRGPIEINTVLAYDWVPTTVVLNTIYHECLHLIIGEDHSPYFNLMEKQFPNHAEVALWESEHHDRLVSATRPLVRSIK